MRRLIYICLLVSAGLLYQGCHKETDEDKVKKVITSIQQAAEDKKIMIILEHLSRTYHDPQGYDYEGIKGLLAFYFYRHQKVRVYIPSLEVAVNGPSSTATFEAVLTGAEPGTSGGTLLPGTLGVYRFEVSLRKDQETWKATSAKWERIGDQPGVVPDKK